MFGQRVMSWQQDEEIPCGQVNQIPPQVGARSKHRAREGIRVCVVCVCACRIVVPWGNKYSTLTRAHTHSPARQKQPIVKPERRWKGPVLRSLHPALHPLHPLHPSVGVTVTSLWNRIGAAPVDREGPVQPSLIASLLLPSLLMSQSARFHPTKSTIDHKQPFAKGTCLFFSDDVVSHAECKENSFPFCWV